MTQFWLRQGYFVGVLVGFFLIWHISSEEGRVENILVSIPAFLVSLFEVLMREISKLEKKINEINK